MKRNKHSLSNYKLLTCNMGALVPVGCYEVLPGDTVQQSTSLLLRVSPLLAPVMHPVTVRIHHWFVPHRLVWPGFEDFITGGQNGQGDGVTVPIATTQPGGVAQGSVADYMGVPPGVAGLSISLIPFRSYNKVFNEYYRDQDLVAEQPEDYYNIQPHPVAWEKDYFTSARPWPQKGPDVTMPLGERAPVISSGDGIPNFQNQYAASAFGTGTNINQVLLNGGNAAGTAPLQWGATKLEADLSNATAVSVNDVRLAFALQRYQEARARYGSRYTEYLRYLGVRSSDARLQRPEYLGGGKQTISFSEVLKTGAQDDPEEPIGSLKGHGIAATRTRRWRRFFEEHGLVISVMSVRPRAIYTDGLHRMFFRRTKEDFFQRELQQIGQQEIMCGEIKAVGDATDGNTFGYQDRYAEYKHLPSTVHGDFRDTLNYWHLGRAFTAQPALNQDFISCYPSNRIYADQTPGSHHLWIMANNNIQARRMVMKSGASRVL